MTQKTLKKPFTYLLYALRPKQWIKNFFVFFPLVFGRKMFSFPANLKTAGAAGVFCLAASAIYLFNDLQDRQADRGHATKKLRPLASGRVSPATAIVTSSILAVSSLLFAWAIDFKFGIVIAIYIVMNVLYSLYLKHCVIIDVFCIALFFILRVVGGTFVADVNFSHWMLSMVALLAMFLAFNKRRQDITLLTDDADVNFKTIYFKYNTYFIDQMISTLTASLVIVYMLYTIDEQTVKAFGDNRLIYTTPFVYYGIFRYLYIVHTKGKGADPTRLILKDRMMLLNVCLWALMSVLLIYY